MLLAIILIIFTCALLALVILRRSSNELKPCQVPGLDASDAKLGNLPDIASSGSLHRFLTNLHERYGRQLASFWFGRQFCISVAHHKTFKEILHLSDRPALLFEFCRPLTGDHSIQFMNGQEWKDTAKILAAPFNHQSCVNLLPDFNQICQVFISRWLEEIPPEEHLPLHESMMSLAIRMITGTQFGAFFKSDEATKKFHRVYDEVMSDLELLLSGDLKRDDRERFDLLEKNLKKFKETVMEIVETHQKAREAGDYEEAPFLDALLDNFGHDPDAMMCQAVTYVVGGFHTTGNFMTWLFHYLSINPEIQQKIFDEIQVVMGDRQDLTETDIKKLSYTSQVLDETLRLSVTAPFAARVSADREIKICGYVIPPNTPIVNALGVSLHDEEQFPDPDRFDPDRFSPDNVKSRPALAFVPFGIGARKCPGYKFTYYEVYAAAVQIIRTFEIRPASGDRMVKPKAKFGFVTKPEEEIWISIRKRVEE